MVLWCTAVNIILVAQQKLKITVNSVFLQVKIPRRTVDVESAQEVTRADSQSVEFTFLEFLHSKLLFLLIYEAHRVLVLHVLSEGKSVPLQDCSGPQGSRKLRFPDFMTMTQGGGKVVSLTHRPHLPPGNSPGTHFCWRLSRPQGHSAIICQWKIPTPSGIEPATFWFVAQHLNHWATAVPWMVYIHCKL